MSDYNKTKKALLEAGQLFEDDDFPAEFASLAFKEMPSWGEVEWKRPREICDDPQFIVDGASRFDLSQGALGNCWFISAAANLATRPSLLRKVCPRDQTLEEGKYAGIFRFRFWRFGHWMDVVVDDRLPVKAGTAELIFCQNNTTANELWPALMEKAYAKIHGTYLSLEAGYSHDALVDFTGGIGEYIDLSKDYPNRGQLFKLLRRSKKMRSLMCCAIDVIEGGPSEEKLDTGLVTGHAYSITNVVTVDLGGEKCKLLRLRNPWGHREWNGAWSDGSEEWDKISEAHRKRCDLLIENDGEFWISFKDFLENINSIQICNLGPQSAPEEKGETWHSASYDGAWVKGLTAGGCGAPPNREKYWLNSQYVIRLSAPDDEDEDTGDPVCTLVVSLIQKYRREMKNIKRSDSDFEEAIGFDILMLKEEDSGEVGGTDLPPESLRMERKMLRYEHLRERSGRYSLPAGAYCVIPCTYNPDIEAEFLLRLATENDAQSSELEAPSQPTQPKRPKQSGKVKNFGAMFEKHAGEDGVVDARELKKMLNQGLKRQDEEPFDKETARALITLELGCRGKLNRAQCKSVWREVKRLQHLFDEFDADENRVLNKKEMKRAFRSLGFELSKKILVQIAQHFCGKNDTLTLDDFILLATKLAIQFEKYSRLTRKDASKVNMTLDEWLETTILN